MIKLSKNNEMLNLLNALSISSPEYSIKDYYIELKLNTQQIFYRIGAYRDIRSKYEGTNAWKELIEKAGLEGILYGR